MQNVGGTSLTDITGYRVYYGTSATNLANSVAVSGASTANVVVSGLSPGTYYFAVATVNSTATTSALSNAVSKVVQ